jgi:hypothetical protein
MECIVDHKMDEHAVDPTDMCINHGSNNQVLNTTKGWHFCVEWKYGTTTWEHLADLKESNLVEVAEYAVSKNFHDAPAFVWWVLYVLKKRICIIADVTNRYSKMTQKI